MGSPENDAGNGVGGGSSQDNGNAGSNPTESCSSNELGVVFGPDMYSAYIEGSSHQFQLPAITVGAGGGGIKWSASDPSMVLIEPDTTTGGVRLTMRRAGEVTITANARGECGASTLHITAATEAEWQAGNARYNNMNPLPAIPLDGGIPSRSASNAFDPPGMPPACTNCHGAKATSSFFWTTSSTPQQAGGFSDQQLIDLFTKGVVPMDVGGNPVTPPFSYFHSWSDIMGEQARSMVVYLRSLSPSPAPPGGTDFGGLTPPSVQGSSGTPGSSGPPAPSPPP